MSTRLTRLAVVLAATAFLAGVTGPALAKGPALSNWHLGIYNSSGRAFSESQTASGSGLATFHFTTTPDVALLTTNQGSQKGNVLGDITGKNVTATFTITGSNDFQFYGQGQPGGCGGPPPAYVRLYFETSNAGGFDETHYWWSNPSSVTLANGTWSVSAVVDGSQWSDFYGHFGTNTNGDGYQGAAGFAAAASNVKAIGLSFGGGCFFENGVGASNADLTLTAFSAL